jgi:hypothetical protein
MLPSAPTTSRPCGRIFYYLFILAVIIVMVMVMVIVITVVVSTVNKSIKSSIVSVSAERTYGCIIECHKSVLIVRVDSERIIICHVTKGIEWVCHDVQEGHAKVFVMVVLVLACRIMLLFPQRSLLHSLFLSIDLYTPNAYTTLFFEDKILWW